MYNSDTPLRAELPSSKQLLRSTVVAALSALVILLAVVLPAEYGIDPTGLGRVLRMTEMGEVKKQLSAEAAADAAALPAKAVVAAAPEETIKAVAPKLEWRDEMPFTLAPGEGTEIKLKMLAGQMAQFSWIVEGGEVNFDTHGDATGKSISYEKGRGVSSDEGVLEAAFTGNHGWFWRNRGQSDVKVILRTRGEYSDIKRMM